MTDLPPMPPTVEALVALVEPYASAGGDDEVVPFFDKLVGELEAQGLQPHDAWRLASHHVRRWADGGGNVTPAVRAAALLSVAALDLHEATAKPSVVWPTTGTRSSVPGDVVLSISSRKGKS